MENEKTHKGYSFSMPIELADKFDAYLKEHGYGVSEYIRKCFRDDLDQQKMKF